MPQLPKKIKLFAHQPTSPEAQAIAFTWAKLNEIIDYLGELEGGKDAGN